jgi:sulfate adenylyltransferase large subunit
MEDYVMKVVIVGHIDHGKSTLIGRLLLDTNSLPEDKMKEIKRISRELGRDTELAYLIDHLKEEREREMTIDTSQIFFKTRKRHYVIIDAPGHVEFLKNMLTGATQAEAAVLIVDTQAGIKEQTRRHAFLISMLGIRNIIVLCNKMDLINFDQKRFEEIKNELAQFFKNLGVEAAFIIPGSAKEDLNIASRTQKMRWYKGPSLLDALDLLKPEIKTEKKPLRFSIQDSYEIERTKITAGKVLSGTIKQGQEVMLLPSFKNTRINSIKAFGESIKEARAGKNIGLILDDLTLGTRGQIIVEKNDTIKPVDRFKANIFWMSEVPLEINQVLCLRCATQELDCIVEKIEKRIDSSTLEIIENSSNNLKINEAGIVMIKATRQPLVIEKFSFIEELGRFTIEKKSALLGMGIIT